MNRLLLGLACILCSNFIPGGAYADSSTLHGIRNPKCAVDEATAKLDLMDHLRTAKKLCEDGLFPSQVGGWSCHFGRDCPKSKARCITQYVCGPSGSFAAPETTPEPTPSVVVEMPDGASNAMPNAMPNAVPNTAPSAPTPEVLPNPQAAPVPPPAQAPVAPALPVPAMPSAPAAAPSM
jgi:hypothetical protein